MTSVKDVPIQCPRFEEGKEFTQNWYQQFFSQYKNQGGKLDFVMLDMEAVQFFSAYSLRVTHSRCVQDRENCPISWCEAMAADPTWSRSGLSSEIADNLVGTVCGPNWQNYYLEYDEWLEDRLTEYKEEAIVDVAKQYFPHVQASDYGVFHWDEDYPVPYGSIPVYLEGDGSHVGTHQGPFVYGNLHSEESLEISPPLGPGIPNYGQTAFNAFRFDVNWVRSAYFSDPAKLHTWMTNKSYSPSLLAGSDLYQEMLFHVGMMTDIFGYWSYWNDNGTPPPTSFAQYVNGVLKEINDMYGYEDTEAVFIEEEIVPWTQDYVLSGIRVEDYTLWRFTPKNMNGVLVQSGSANGTAPVVFSVGNDTITIPNAKIHTPQNPVSSHGYWVVQAPDAGGPIIAQAQEAQQPWWSHMYAGVWNALEGIADLISNIFNFDSKEALD